MLPSRLGPCSKCDIDEANPGVDSLNDWQPKYWSGILLVSRVNFEYFVIKYMSSGGRCIRLTFRFTCVVSSLQPNDHEQFTADLAHNL